MSHVYDREQVFKMVWSEPITTIAKRVGISDVAVAKKCRAAGIPLPERGYWAKKEAGKPVSKAFLPTRALGQSDQVALGPHDPYARGLSDAQLIDVEIPPLPVYNEDLGAVQAKAQAIATRVRPTTLATVHPVTARLLSYDEVRRKKFAEMKWSGYAPVFDAPPGKRRLQVINSLCNALASCGCKCAASGKDGYEFSVYVGDQHLGLTLAPTGYDRADHRNGQPVRDDGKLFLKIGWYHPPTHIPTQWSDEDGHLEKRIREIVTDLLVAGEFHYRASLEHHRNYIIGRKNDALEEQRRRKSEAEKQERERIALATRKRREELIGEVKSWKTAIEIREFVQARLAKENRTADLDAWAKWALAEANSIDPLAQ